MLHEGLLHEGLRRLGPFGRGLQMLEWLLATCAAGIEDDPGAAEWLIERCHACLNGAAHLNRGGARPAVLGHIMGRGRNLGHLADAANTRHLLDLLEDRPVAVAFDCHRLGCSVTVFD